MLETLTFIVVTLVLAFISRASLRKPGSHGFFRFIAWECMLGLLVMNMRVWYVDVDSPHQLIAGMLFFISLLLVVFGVVLLRVSGKPDSRRNDAPMLGFEKTTILVTSGIYRYIRHPMYSSLIFLGWGLFFKQPSIAGSVLAVVASVFMIATARSEERENIGYFGEAYSEYMKRSKMFVPFIV